ncbi:MULTISPECIES: hypothetical protein [unclassified Streptomyces]|uniref:hypothetical protein n=1 Tax=unclassified Streptomyces TaxID=2593676 RepID=UPI001BECDB1F|nr:MULTISPECIES: hypothetical protein [unclassified Streptomyces]MBT2404614.1 hypothetical protein [Streptomyces sp. ISL-21]MBT2610497.1 hypothetical protein [Streptomyces sp. ISL-87]
MSAGGWGELHGPTRLNPPRKRRHARPDGNVIAGLLMTTGNVLGLAVLALSCADQADGATAVPSITVADQAPAEVQPSRRPANDTAHTISSSPAARTTPSRACRCGPHTRPTV